MSRKGEKYIYWENGAAGRSGKNFQPPPKRCSFTMFSTPQKRPLLSRPAKVNQTYCKENTARMQELPLFSRISQKKYVQQQINSNIIQVSWTVLNMLLLLLSYLSRFKALYPDNGRRYKRFSKVNNSLQNYSRTPYRLGKSWSTNQNSAWRPLYHRKPRCPSFGCSCSTMIKWPKRLWRAPHGTGPWMKLPLLDLRWPNMTSSPKS